MTQTKFAPLEEWVFAYLDHELRTPLNAMLGFSQMMRDGFYGEVNDTQLDRLERILRNTRHVLRSLDLLLDFDRMNQGQLDLTQAHVSLSDLLQETLSMAEFDSWGRPLQVVLPQEMPNVELAVNKTWACVALREIILHAATEAIPDPAVHLCVEPERGSSLLPVTVRYHAPPMDTWHQGQLFTIQNQTGIGLPLAFELVSRMNGRVDYDSVATHHIITLFMPIAGT